MIIKSRTVKSATLLACLMTFGAASPAIAQDNYPDRSVRVIIPWGAGGGTDVTLRGFLNRAGQQMKMEFNVSNVTGGGGAVGWREAAAADADGYTLSGLTYDLLMITAKNGPVSYRDFVPLVTVAQYPQALAVAAGSGIETFKQFIESARKTPPAVAMSGFGNIHHLAAVGIQEASGIKMRLVPFEGGAAGIAALLGGNVQAVFTDVPESKGRPDLRVLVQFAAERHPDMPDVPTARELGVDVVLASFRSIGAPAGTPDKIISHLRKGFDQVWHSDDFQAWARTANISASYLSGKDTEAMFETMMPLLKEWVPRLQ